MELHENSQAPEVAMLVGIDTDDYDAEVSIDELEELARAEEQSGRILIYGIYC